MIIQPRDVFPVVWLVLVGLSSVPGRSALYGMEQGRSW